MIVKKDHWVSIVQRSFNDRKKRLLKTIVQRSFNDRKKGSLKTIVQRSLQKIVGFRSLNDRSLIVKKDRWISVVTTIPKKDR